MANYTTTVGVQIEAMSDSEIQSLKKLQVELNKVITQLQAIAQLTKSVKVPKSSAGSGDSVSDTTTISATTSSTTSAITSTNKFVLSLKALQRAAYNAKIVLSRLSNAVKNMTSVFKINVISLAKMIFFLNMFKYFGDKITSVIKKSTDFGETINLWSVAIKDAEKSALHFQNTLTNTIGLSMNTMMEAQAKFKNMIGNLSKDITNAQQELISQTISLMALDYASLYNVDFESAVTKFMAALAGQVRPIRGTSGYDITQVTLQETLKKMNINRTVSSLSQVEKRLLIIVSLMNQMQDSGAMNDFAKTLERPANQIRILKELWSDFTMYLGGVFYPVLIKILPVLNGVVWAMKELAKTFSLINGFNPMENADFLDPLQEDVEETSESLDNLKKKAAGFDELNVVSNNTSDDEQSLGGISNELIKAMSIYESKLLETESKASKLRDRIMEWLGFTKQLNEETGELTWKFSGLSAKALGSKMGSMITETINSFNPREFANKFIGFINKGLGLVANLLTETDFNLLGQKIYTYLEYSFTSLDFTSLGTIFMGKVNALLDLGLGFLQNYDVRLFAENVTELVKSIINNIDMEKVKTFLYAAAQTLAASINLTNNNIPAITEKIVEFINYLGDSIVLFLINADLQPIFKALFDITGAILGNMIKVLPTLIETFVEALTGFLESFFTNENWLWVGLAIVGGIALALFGAPSLLATAIAAVVTGLIAQFCSLLGIHSPSKVFKEQIGANIIAGIKEGLLGGITTLKNAAMQVVNSIVGCFSNIGTTIKNKVNSGLNSAKEFISDIPIIGGVAKYIPTFANGGFPTQGQMFIARESGAEMVGSINGRTAVANNSDIVMAVSSGVESAMLRAMNSGSQNVTITLDGKVLAKSTIKNINQMTKQNGYSPLMI